MLQLVTGLSFVWPSDSSGEGNVLDSSAVLGDGGLAMLPLKAGLTSAGDMPFT